MTRPIYVRFSDDGKHIAKWSHEPFEPSESYVPGSAQPDQAREEERERIAKMFDDGAARMFDLRDRSPFHSVSHDALTTYAINLRGWASQIRDLLPIRTPNPAET